MGPQNYWILDFIWICNHCVQAISYLKYNTVMCAPSLILYVNMIFYVGKLQIILFNLFSLFLTLFINCSLLLCNYISFYTCYVDLWISYELRLQTITPYQFCQNVVRGSNQVTVLHRKTWPLFAVVLFKQWIKERKVFVSIEQSYLVWIRWFSISWHPAVGIGTAGA